MGLEGVDEKLLKKVDSVSKGSRILAFITLPGLFLLISFGTIEINRQYKQIDSLSTVKEDLGQQVKGLDQQVKDLETKKVSLQAELMNKFGLPIDTTKVQSSTAEMSLLKKSVEANQNLKLAISDSAVTKGIIVKYYLRTIEEKRIAFELQTLGYEFEPGTPKSNNKDRPTNAIFFGRGVPLNDIKIVSLAFIRAGIPIQGIQPFTKSLKDPSYKRYTIEVGTSIFIDNLPIVDPDDVRTATAFKRLNANAEPQ